jgi:DNA ligase (NAD+)
MNKIERIKELTKELQQHCLAYYKYDKPIISDREYDKLYDELETLEQETGFILNNSPTQKVQGEVLDKLTKVAHTTEMLSAKKTKDINEIISFANDKVVVNSFKLDGLTIVVKYKDGKFYQAITRGSGTLGEDITHNMQFCISLPKQIEHKGYLELRGEGVISWSNFNLINNELTVDEQYAHPRNLASGSVRQLNSNIFKDRLVDFVAFNIVECDINFKLKQEQLFWLINQGFKVVDYVIGDSQTIEDIFNRKLVRENYEFPTDGRIVEYDDLDYSKSLGATSHHCNNLMAFKDTDDTVETKFLGIDVKTSRNGIVSLTAIFEPCTLDNTVIERASVHNVDIFESYEFGVGDIITIYKANSIIPQISENLTKSGTYQLPTHCPSCGEELVIERPNKTRVLCCRNEECPSKILGQFVHFVGKNGANIDGLSEATLEVFLKKGWVKTFKDLFYLDRFKSQIINTDGFGERSYSKLIESIENSRNIKLENYLVSLGIPNIGRTASKTISKYFNGGYYKFIQSCEDGFDFTTLDDFGTTMNDSIKNWYKQNGLDYNLWTEFKFIIEEKSEEPIDDNIFKGKTFCVTGSFSIGSRDYIKELVEKMGGKFVSSVSKKTDMLLMGQKAGSKHQKALDCGVRIIEEEEFVEIFATEWLNQFLNRQR